MVFGNLLAIFTLDGQIVWMDKSSCICLSDVNLCRTVVDLFVSTHKSSGKNHLSRQPNIRQFVCQKFVHLICTSDNLFI